MNPTEIIRQANLWKQRRDTTMFEIPAMTRENAETIQNILKGAGFIAYIVTMGKEINVTLYLSDHK